MSGVHCHVAGKKRTRRKETLVHVVACVLLSTCRQPSEAFTVPTGYTDSKCCVGCYPHRKGNNRKRYRQKVSSLFADTPSDASSSEQQQEQDTPSNADDREWKVGNVYDDLDKLRREIAISNAEQHLRQVEDRERLDTFASNRRPIHRDIRRFVLTPLVLSIFLAIVSKSRRVSSLSRIFTGLFELHFMIVVVAMPMLLLLAKRRSLPPPPPPPSELKGLDSEYYRFVVTDWEDPKKSCRDHVLCLLENWTSAVVGPAILTCIYVLLPIRKGATSVKLGVVASQLITRLGVIAALYQYPKLLYQLRRRHQPRPMDRYTLRLRQLAWFALSLASLGIASDLSKVWSHLPPKVIASLVSLGLIPYAKHRLIRGTQARPLTIRAAALQSLVYTALTATQLTAVWSLCGMLMSRWRTWTPSATSYKVLAATGVCLSVLLAG